MKIIKVFILLTLVTTCLNSCTININYPQSGIVDCITANGNTESPKEIDPPDTTFSPESSRAPESSEPEDNSDTSEITVEPESEAVSVTEETTIQEDSSAAPITEETASDTEPESTAEETEFKLPIYMVDLTTPIWKNKTATIGQPNTEYSIEVMYSTGKSTAKGLENKISGDEGFVSWSWKIGPSVKSGYYQITITGGGQSFSTNMQVY